MSKYTYPSDADFETQWIEAHSPHRVEVGSGNWIVCVTCASPIHLTTRDVSAVMRELHT